LENGGLLSYAIGNKKSHELPLFREKWSTFERGDIFLGDKVFCSYFDIAKLKDRGLTGCSERIFLWMSVKRSTDKVSLILITKKMV